MKSYLTPESHLAAMDARVTEIHATVKKLYATWYAANIRRKGKYGKQMQQLMANAKVLKEHMPTMRRITILAKSLEAGRYVVTLPKDQYQKLMWMLRDKEETKEPGEV